MKVLDKAVQVNGTSGDAVVIRTYAVQDGERVYTNVCKIKFDGTIETVGEVKEQLESSAV